MQKIQLTWSSTHWFEAVIDLDDPHYAGLSREDFPADTQKLSVETLGVLETLENGGATLVNLDGTEIHTVKQVFTQGAAVHDRANRHSELSRKYPYIYANGTDNGSNSSYVWNEAEQADHDGAPSGAVHRDEWASIDSHGRQEAALEAEKTGGAFIVRDENGDPYRVWHLISNYPPGALRERLVRFAGRIAAGQSPWIEKVDEQ